jgi:UDP-N-acetylmuramate--alanine ligase
MKKNGTVIAQKNIPILSSITCPNIISYSLTDNAANLAVQSYSINDGKYQVEVRNQNNEMHSYDLGLAGYHNVENSLAAIAVAELLKIPFEKTARALASFRGIKRRFETIFQNEKHVYIDDYAHHPEEIKVFLGSVKEMYPNKKITAIFQPHLFSITKDLQAEFAQQLSVVDQLFLLDIYPAREKPMEGVTAQLILDQVNIRHKEIISKEEVLQRIATDEIEILVTIGAGDIDRLIIPIKNILTHKSSSN